MRPHKFSEILFQQYLQMILQLKRNAVSRCEHVLRLSHQKFHSSQATGFARSTMSAKKKVATPVAKVAATPATPVRKSKLEMDPEGDESSWMSPVVKYTALGLICLISFSIRLFAVARWESVMYVYLCVCLAHQLRQWRCVTPLLACFNLATWQTEPGACG